MVESVRKNTPVSFPGSQMPILARTEPINPKRWNLPTWKWNLTISCLSTDSLTPPLKASHEVVSVTSDSLSSLSLSLDLLGFRIVLFIWPCLIFLARCRLPLWRLGRRLRHSIWVLYQSTPNETNIMFFVHHISWQHIVLRGFFFSTWLCCICIIII